MPYMFSQGAADVPCTLLHFVIDELVDVVKGKIIQPGNDELLPPIRPAGADEEDEMTLSSCVSWPLLWPKSRIRLGAGDTTPQTRPPVVPAPSHGKNAATLPDLPDIPMAQDPDGDDNDDGTFTKVDKYFAEHG